MESKRELWTSRSGFILASIGAAVGLGNLWRFPFQAYKNGGGAFLLPYIVALLSCAIPLMILEYTYGRKVRGGSIKAFKTINNKYEWIGWMQVMVPIVVMMFYCTIISVSLIFMVWSIGHAFGLVSFLSNPGELMGMITGSALGPFDFKSGVSKYLFFFVILVWIANFIIVRKGISKGIEKVSKIFTPVLIILMFVFMLNSIRLDGAIIGLKQLFTPNFTKILNPNIWISAYAQVFFSTTLAVGVMIAYGSYLKEESDIVGSSIITVMSNAAFDLIAGITVFSVLGYLVTNMGVKFDSFGNGAGVAFIAFPIAISTITSNVFLQGIIGFLFFFCLFIAGLSSSISMLEAFTTSALDKFKIKREKIVMWISIIGFIGSLSFSTFAGFNYILDIVDSYVGNYVIATLGLVETIFISYFYGAEKIRIDANKYSKIKIGKYFNFLLKYVTPFILGITVITNIIKEIKKLLELIEKDLASFMGQIVFGWGVILLMLLFSILLYLKKED